MKRSRDLTKTDYSHMSYGERVTAQFLDYRHYSYYYGLVPSFLNGLHLDFYVPAITLALEYDGNQHIDPSMLSAAGDNESISNYCDRRYKDRLKDKLCTRQGITLIRIENYTRKDLDKYYIWELLNRAIRKAKKFRHNHIYGKIIREPYNVRYFHVNKKMIEQAQPIKDKATIKCILHYLTKHYGIQANMLAQMLIISFLHTKDVFKITYKDVVNNGHIKADYYDSNQLIGLKHHAHNPPFLKRAFKKYIDTLASHHVRSKWLFPNLNDYSKHIPFKHYSKIINDTANHLHLDHFNIYSFRKTGGYMVYSQYGINTAATLLYESDNLSAYKYLGYNTKKISDDIMDHIKFI